MDLITTNDSSTLYDNTASIETDMDTAEGSNEVVLLDRSVEEIPVVVESPAQVQVVAQPQPVLVLENQPLPGVIVGGGNGQEILTNRNTALNLTNKMPQRLTIRHLG